MLPYFLWTGVPGLPHNGKSPPLAWNENKLPTGTHALRGQVPVTCEIVCRTQAPHRPMQVCGRRKVTPTPGSHAHGTRRTWPGLQLSGVLKARTHAHMHTSELRACTVAGTGVVVTGQSRGPCKSAGARTATADGRPRRLGSAQLPDHRGVLARAAPMCAVQSPTHAQSGLADGSFCAV